MIDALARGPLVLDGATGTELTRRGVPTPLPLWSGGALESHPDVVEQIHRDYVQAGADIVVANTFRTNVRTLRGAGRLEEGPNLNRVAVELARRAAAGRAWVAASVAPLEDCYYPERVPDEAVLRAEHGRMAAWLKAARPDLIWIETMNTIREARAAAEAAADTALPFVVSFVTREGGDLLSGESLEEAVAAVDAFAPLAIGLNCIPPKGVSANLPRLRRATQRPLAAYAHIGNPDPINGWSFSQTIAPSVYAECAREWLDLGASIIGGCCGTTPEHIRAAAAILRGRID
jgi:homocysteine S-methyltransferase